MLEVISKDQYRKSVGYLEGYLATELRHAEERFVNLGGLKTVRMLVCDGNVLQIIDRELPWVLTAPCADPDATLIIWKEDRPADFFHRVLRLSEEEHTDGSAMLLYREGGVMIPFAETGEAQKTVLISDGDTYYFGSDKESLEEWFQDGSFAVQFFYRILNTPSSSLVHGACVGIDGNGLLLCARGQCGKSTLTVTAMLKGFEYVADDYLILHQEADRLEASPIYSIIKLSPKMYNALYDDMGKARFLGIGNWKGKYVFDISRYQDQVRYRYPVRACLFPEITPDAAEPSVRPCSDAEKGKAMIHLVHSTVAQNMYSTSLMQAQKNSEAIRKLIGMLQGMPFYKIILSPDIFKNVECLRTFVAGLK